MHSRLRILKTKCRSQHILLSQLCLCYNLQLAISVLPECTYKFIGTCAIIVVYFYFQYFDKGWCKNIMESVCINPFLFVEHLKCIEEGKRLWLVNIVTLIVVKVWIFRLLQLVSSCTPSLGGIVVGQEHGSLPLWRPILFRRLSQIRQRLHDPPWTQSRLPHPSQRWSVWVYPW